MNSLNNNIIDRKSTLAFSSVELQHDQIESLFEAARWAPSSYNEQPWKFFFASRTNTDNFKRLLSFLMPGNIEWAQNSSIIIISTARMYLSLNGKENIYAMHDTGMATANLLIQAQSMGLATHVMGGFDRDGAKKYLSLTEEWIAVSAIAVGYPGDKNLLSEANLKRANAPRVRKLMEDIVQEI
jgi:nitroreductase